jgi:predicted phosphodiesterase
MRISCISRVMLYVRGNGDHSQIPLQHQFLSNILCSQVLYVVIHGKSQYETALTVSFLVAEQEVNLCILS